MNKSPESNSKNEPHDELRQQLWELSYGLLEDDVAAALRTQIKSDPAIARLYAEVRLQAELVGRAARVEDSALHISAGPDAKVAKAGSRSHSKTPASKSWQAAEQRSWGTNWLAVGGTVALLVLLAFGLYQPQTVKTSVAQADYFFTQITAPANTPEGVTQTVEINTTDVNNNGRSAEIEVRLVDQQGRETFRRHLKTSQAGRGAVELPGKVLKPGVKLEAIPKEGRERATAVVSAELQVTEEKKRQLLLLEKPAVKAGETVGFSMLKIGEYSKQVAAPDTDELMIENHAGADVVQPTWEADRKAGVISGQFALPANRAIESEQLALRRRALQQDQLAKAEDGRDSARKADMLTERQELPLDHAGKRSANRSLANGALAGGSAFGGNAAADADGNRLLRGAAKSVELKANPMYKAAGSVEGEAKADMPDKTAEGSGDVHIPALSRGVPQNAPLAPGAPAKPAAAPPAPAAPAPPQLAPAALPDQADRKNMEKRLADAPAQANGSAAAPPAPSGKAGAMKLQQGGYAKGGPGEAQDNAVERAANPQPRPQNLGAPAAAARAIEAPAIEAFSATLPSDKAAGQDLPALVNAAELQLPADLQEQELILVARRGSEVITRREITVGKKLKPADLPPEVAGRVEIELYRKGFGTEPAYRQELVRSAVHSLRFDVAGLKESYAPGEKVKLQVRVVDEQGQPASEATVGVRVWNDVAAAATNAPLLLVDQMAREEDFSVRPPQQLALAAPPQGAQAREAAKQSAFAANAAVAAAAAPGQLAPSAEAGISPEQPQRFMKRVDAEKDKAFEQPAAENEAAPIELQFDAQTQEAPASIDAPQVVADNRAVVQQEYEAALAATQAAHFDRIRAIGRVLVWAGAGVMLLIGVLLMIRSQLKTAVWVPTVGIAAACLALGLAWFVPAQPLGWDVAQVENYGAAPAPFEATQPAEPPTVAVGPTAPVDAPATGGDLPNEALKEIAPGTPSEKPAQPGDSVARGAVTDEKMKLQAPLALRSEQPLADVKQGDAQAALAAADKPQAKKSDERESLERRRFNGGGAFTEAAPDTLFWRPLSPIGADGYFTIEFNMPAAESDYRLLLDAIGNGRIGGQQQLLLCREAQ